MDHAAWDRLAEALPRICRTLQRALGISYEDAEDLVQMAIVEVLRTAEVPEINTVTGRAIWNGLDLLRDRNRRDALLRTLAATSAPSQTDEEAIFRLILEEVWEVIRSLSPQQREDLLRHAAGHRNAELAGKGRSVKAVANSHATARRALRHRVTPPFALLLAGLVGTHLRRLAHSKPTVAGGLAVGGAAAVFSVMLHFLPAPTLAAPRSAAAATEPVIGTVVPPPSHTDVGPPTLQDALAPAGLARPANRGTQKNESPKTARVVGMTVAAVGATASAEVQYQDNGKDLVEQILACASPGGFSLDPHHFGCH